MAEVSTQDYGIKVARPGYDARTCPDWALLFNSSWPSLAVAFEVTIDIPTPDDDPIVTVAHNLGFPPLTIGWLMAEGVSYGRIDGSTITVTDTDIIFFGNPAFLALPDIAGKVLIRCFNINCVQEQEYPLPISSSVKLPYDPSFGIKVAKSGKFITSNDLRDFVLHSRAQSPAILTIVQGNNSDPRLSTYELKTSYIPWVFALSEFGSFYPTASIWYNPATNTITAASDNIAPTLIVLRDPLFPSATVEVTY